MPFRTNYRKSAYVTPNSPKGGSKANLSCFVDKIQFRSNKVCCKVFLCKNFQRQSCSRAIPLSNGYLGGKRNLQPNIQPPSDPLPSTKKPIVTYYCLSCKSQRKMFNYNPIESRLSAFQRAKDESHTLSGPKPHPQKGWLRQANSLFYE